MPLPLLIAIVLAFGLETSADAGSSPGLGIAGEAGLVLAGLAAVAGCAWAAGRSIASRAGRLGGATPRLRRQALLASRLLDLLALAAFGWMIHGLGWREAVRGGLGLRDAILVDEALILIPFLAAQLACWWGLYPAERAVRPAPARGTGRAGAARHLLRKARQSMGLVLPVILIFTLGQDLVGRSFPAVAADPWTQVGVMALMGVLVLVLSPAFVRLAWPTRRLEPGPLRDRLEALARRHRFRCTDILVWETGGAVVNAGVTGALPWFRYVLLTDAMIENLHPRQVAAVFGHEIGHIAHRHLLSFGLFFLGSLGILALAGQGIEAYVDLPAWLDSDDLSLTTLLQSLLFLGFVAGYFLAVFGLLSRRFERQADVYGCRAVSCGRTACPPHADLGALDEDAQLALMPDPAGQLCPVGIRIFADALIDVARLNGIDREGRSWRHGSIARRVEFLAGLEGRPEAERRFQRGTLGLKLGLLLVLAGSVALAIAAGSVEYLGR